MAAFAKAGATVFALLYDASEDARPKTLQT